jgi:hypothetical protein
MEEHPEVDICGAWAEIIGNKSGMIKMPVNHKAIVTSMLLYNPMVHPTVILRKSVYENAKFLYQEGYDCAEDYKLWTDLATAGCRFANIPEVLLQYRRSDNQVTTTRQEMMQRLGLKIRGEYAEYVMGKIVKEDEKFYDFFDLLIEYTNERSIGFKQFSNIIFQLYVNYCH